MNAATIPAPVVCGYAAALIVFGHLAARRGERFRPAGLSLCLMAALLPLARLLAPVDRGDTLMLLGAVAAAGLAIMPLARARQQPPPPAEPLHRARQTPRPGLSAVSHDPPSGPVGGDRADGVAARAPVPGPGAEDGPPSPQRALREVESVVEDYATRLRLRRPGGAPDGD